MTTTLNKCDNCEELVTEELTKDVYNNGFYYCDECHEIDVDEANEYASFVHDHRRGGWTTG